MNKHSGRNSDIRNQITIETTTTTEDNGSANGNSSEHGIDKRSAILTELFSDGVQVLQVFTNGFHTHSSNHVSSHFSEIYVGESDFELSLLVWIHLW